MKPVRERIETHSPTWAAIAEWAAAERVKAAERVLARGIDHAETEALRARVATLDDLIRLPVPDRIAASLAGSSSDYGIGGAQMHGM